MPFPNRDELKEIREVIAATNAPPAAEAAVIKAFKADDITLAETESFLVLHKDENPKLWEPTEAAKPDHSELMQAAFAGNGGKGSPDARGKLVLAIGEDAAHDAARTYGLKSLHDYISKGAAPVADDGKGDKSVKPKADNPWSAAGWNVTRQGALIKSIGPEKAAGIAKAAGSFIGATKPAKV